MAEYIGVEWETIEGGIGVRAATDSEGSPILGLYTINRMGQPNGQPFLVCDDRFSEDIVIGLDKKTAIVIFAKALITPQGLRLDVIPPLQISHRNLERTKVALWGSKPPERDFYARPSGNDGESVNFYYSRS